MGKPRQKQKRAGRANKKDNLFGLNYFATYDSDVDLNGEDGWLMVKKQGVTILVTPLRVTKKSVMLEPGPSPPEITPSVTVHGESQCTKKTVQGMNSIEKLKTSTKPDKKGAEKPSNVTSGQNISMSKPLNSNLRTEIEHPDPVGPPIPKKVAEECNQLKSINRPTPSLGPKCLINRPTPSLGPKCLLDCSMLNKKMRMTNLERKLQKAGGLNRWLASLGLSQFIKIFERSNFSKTEMVSLTMNKLKDMGANAVGPRRKLIHAIHCVC